MEEIAKILKPQGIKGEVKALPLTNVLAVFVSLNDCTVAGKPMHIQHIAMRQGFLYIKFKEVTTRNQAEELRNQTICVDKARLAQAKADDEFFIDDLVGMVLHDTDGNFVGQIVDVTNYGSCDVFVLDLEGRRAEAPYVKDVFIKDGDRLVVDRKKLQEALI